MMTLKLFALGHFSITNLQKVSSEKRRRKLILAAK